MTDQKTVQQQEKKGFFTKLSGFQKFIIISIIIYIFVVSLMVFLKIKEYISLFLLLAFIATPLFLVGLILLMYFFYKKIESNKQLSEYDLKRKLDASTIRPWVKEWFKKNETDDVEILSCVIEHVGTEKSGIKVPIAVLNLQGMTTHKNYWFIVHLYEPNSLNSLVSGLKQREDIERIVERMVYTRPYKPKKERDIETIEGTRIHEEQDIEPPEIDEDKK